jgi:diacylglycerol kinase (ATP)
VVGASATSKGNRVRKVRVLINPRSGVGWSTESILPALARHWDVAGIDLSLQYSKNARDGKDKVGRAIEDGVDTILVVGGDGMVNSIGSALIGTGVALGVVPAGSGNGFARHFEIPLQAERAVASLVDAHRVPIDVGTANGQPFFVTCSMAWDAALVETFEKSPVRGILPYVMAAAYQLLEYRPQRFEVVIDEQERVVFNEPMVFTAANLTQYGGGAKIAPSACPDDGHLELIVVARQDMPKLLANAPRLFAGTLDRLPEVVTRRFRSLNVRRARSAPIQLDGELINAPAEVSLAVMPRALTVLVPGGIPPA